MARKSLYWFCLGVGLTAVAVYACLRIEVFNTRAGGYLPRQPDPDGRISRWREAASPAVRLAMEERFVQVASFPNALVHWLVP